MLGYGALALVVNAGSAQAEPLVLLALGDSLTAGYGLPADQSFPAQLERRLAKDGLKVKVVNAGLSGDTSAGGLARLDWVLSGPKADAAIVELGANDALRGLPPAKMKENLDAVVQRLQQRRVKVLLAGMLAPPNLGRAYGEEYTQAFRQVAQTRKTAFYPFFLDGVAGKPGLNQKDGMHPTGQGVAVIVENILPHVKALLAQTGEKP
jgi:acyl-CoA thioesterase-1